MLQFLIDNPAMTAALVLFLVVAVVGVVYGVATRGRWVDRGFMLRDGVRLRWAKERIPLAIEFEDLPDDVAGAVRLAISAVADAVGREVLRETSIFDLAPADVVVRVSAGGSPGSTSLEFDPRTGAIRRVEVRVDAAVALAILPVVALHEVGHVLGLDHDEGRTSVMRSVVSERPTGLTASDRELLRATYGV